MEIPKDEYFDKIEKEHLEKRNAESRERLKKEYLDVKNIGIVFIDFVPYEKKTEMIEGLKELFKAEGEKQPAFSDESRFDQIPDIRRSGMMGLGGSLNLGIIFNSDIEGQLLLGIQKKLPDETQYIQVHLGQFVDFAYYIIYSCLIKEEYQNRDVEKSFVESQDFVPYKEKTSKDKEIRGERLKGPKLEPTMQEYQRNLEDFLRKFSCGLFLNKGGKDTACPNLKVLSVPKIDFDSFEVWEKDYFDFLRFIGFNFIYSRFENMLIGYYPERLFAERPSSVSQGLVFLASLADFKGEGDGKPIYEVLDKIEYFALMGLGPFLHSLYWPMFTLEIIREEWEKKAIDILENVQSSKTKKAVSKDIYDRALESHLNFNRYFIGEIRNIEATNQNLMRFKPFTTDKYPLKSRNTIDIFDDLVKGGERFRNMEKNVLTNLKHQFETLFSYCNNLTSMSLDESNLNLQKSMRRMTIAMLILTITTVMIAIIDKFGSAIWNFLFN